MSSATKQRESVAHAEEAQDGDEPFETTFTPIQKLEVFIFECISLLFIIDLILLFLLGKWH